MDILLLIFISAVILAMMCCCGWCCKRKNIEGRVIVDPTIVASHQFAPNQGVGSPYPVNSQVPYPVAMPAHMPMPQPQMTTPYPPYPAGQPPVAQMTPYPPASGIIPPMGGAYPPQPIPDQMPPSYNEAVATAPPPRTNELYSKQSPYNPNF